MAKGTVKWFKILPEGDSVSFDTESGPGLRVVNVVNFNRLKKSPAHQWTGMWKGNNDG